MKRKAKFNVLKVKISGYRHLKWNYFLKHFVLFFILIPSLALPGPLQEHREASHQCGPFKLQICLSSLYSSLFLHGHYREVHHLSGESFATFSSFHLRISLTWKKSPTSHALALCGLFNVIVFANYCVGNWEIDKRFF